MRAFTAAEWNALVALARQGKNVAPRADMLEFAAHNLRQNFTSADDVLVPGRDVLDALMSAEGATQGVINTAVNQVLRDVKTPEELLRELGNTSAFAKAVKVVPKTGDAVHKKAASMGIMDKVGEKMNLTPAQRYQAEAYIRQGLFKAFPLKEEAAAADSLSSLALTPYQSAVGETLLVADLAPNYAFRASIVDIQPGKIVVVDRTNLCLREFRP